MKALDERLKKSSEPLNWPSLDEAGSSSTDEAPGASDPAPMLPQPDAVVVERTLSPANTDPPPQTQTHEQPKTETV